MKILRRLFGNKSTTHSSDVKGDKLKKLLADNYISVEQGIWALARKGDDETTNALIDELNSDGNRCASDAAYGLGYIANQRSIGALIDKLSTSETFLCEKIADALRISGKNAVSQILTFLNSGADEKAKAYAVLSLGGIENESAVEGLIKALNDPALQFSAAIAAGFSNDVRLKVALNRLCETYNQDNQVHRTATKSLEKIRFRTASLENLRISNTSNMRNIDLSQLVCHPNPGTAIEPYSSEEKALAAFSKVVNRAGETRSAWPVCIQLFKNPGLSSLVDEPYYLFITYVYHKTRWLLGFWSNGRDDLSSDSTEIGGGGHWEVYTSTADGWASAMGLRKRRVFHCNFSTDLAERLAI